MPIDLDSPRLIAALAAAAVATFLLTGLGIRTRLVLRLAVALYLAALAVALFEIGRWLAR